ncbi:Cytochrome c-type biogenesis protein ccdA (plasmid) [Roseomonas mucosa]|uniref:cytochrome c biogenesis CcdA family protein n=1 Tax=Roseomonas mucosa TaxID=207340 RepID=UPI00220416D9|nr:cytochrome c biogenesis protein CcdA [Roseomonas mucosa]MDT8350911.1 cytochrome c biogenesis protein CcdA [Roseomonas mucosa]QDJ12088.1 Cytochrome c-type biogenesis protein ccdA [Roseomonas mucosa]UZO94668.1 Cytochrome c-type biogenesis protein ccdA [Roseomonas mucosa]
MTPDLSLLGLVLAFGGGLVSFLSPCVLPLVPGYVAWVAGTDLATARAERWRALRLAAFFVLGFGLVFVLLGLGATAVGGLLRRWSYELMVAGGLLIAALGLVQAGLLRVAPLMRDLRFRSEAAGGGPGSAVLIGIAFGFGWTPCIGPVLAGVLAAATLTPGAGAGLLAAYALGLGVPFLLAAFYLPALMARARRLGRLGRALQVASGAVMVAAGLAMATGELNRLAVWLVETFPFFLRFG